jgi:hypothetical protein
MLGKSRHTQQDMDTGGSMHIDQSGPASHVAAHAIHVTLLLPLLLLLPLPPL